MTAFHKIVGAALSLFTALSVSAADFPSKPIRLIVVYQAGGANDIVARAVGDKMSVALGQPVLIENKPGASGMIGAKYVASSAPDGHTLLVGGAAVTVAPAMFKAPMVDAKKELVAVGQMVDLPIVLAAAKGFEANTPAELVALAKAKPGAVTVAITAPTYMFYAERLNAMAGISLLRVPYKGVADAMNDVPNGRVNLVIDSVAAQVPHIKAGRTKAIAVTTATRQPSLPDVPTLNEAGFAGFVDSPFIGLLAPAGTPPAVIARINREMRKALDSQDVKTKLTDMGFVVSTGTPEEFAERLRVDTERYESIGRAANIAKE